MSENDELKKAANAQRAHEQVNEIATYLDSLTQRVEAGFKRRKDAEIIFFVAWFAWVLCAWLAPAFAIGFQIIFIGALSYSWVRQIEVSRGISEFMGAIRILEILGMIGPHDAERHKRKRHVWSEGADMVKSWFVSKKKAQEEVFA